MKRVKSSCTEEYVEKEEQEEENPKNVHSISRLGVSESKQYEVTRSNTREFRGHDHIEKEPQEFKLHHDKCNHKLNENFHSKVSDKYQYRREKYTNDNHNRITIDHNINNINLTRSSQLFEENVFLPLSLGEQEVIKHLDFFKQWYLLCHACYILLLASIASAIFYWSEPDVNFVDALFVAMSTVCNCGLATIDMNHWSTMTLLWRYILMLSGGIVLTSSLPSILRLFMLYKVWPVFKHHSSDSMSVSKLRRSKLKHACRLWRTSLICAFSTVLYFTIVNVSITLCMWIGNNSELSLVQVIGIAMSAFHGCVFNSMHEYAEDGVVIGCTLTACALGFTAFPIVLRYFFKFEWFVLRLLCRLSHWRSIRSVLMRREETNIDDTDTQHPLLNENCEEHDNELITESHCADKQVDESNLQRWKRVGHSHTMISTTNCEHTPSTFVQTGSAECLSFYNTNTNNDNDHFNFKSRNYCNKNEDKNNMSNNKVKGEIINKENYDEDKRVNSKSCSFDENDQNDYSNCQEQKEKKSERLHYVPCTNSHNRSVLQMCNDHDDEESQVYEDEVVLCLLNEWDAAFDDILSSSNPGAFHSFLFSSSEVHYLALAWITLTLIQALPFWLPTWHSLLTAYSLPYKIYISICQAGVVRFAGISFLTTQEFSHGHVALTMFAMFIPALPISTDRTYRKWKEVFRTSVVRLLTSRLFWLFIAILTVIFNEEYIIEERKDDLKFDIMTRVFFEVISAYANCGLSLSFDDERHVSFSGFCQPLSRIVILLVIFGGRHRFVDLGIDLGFSSLQSQLEVSEIVEETESAQQHMRR